MAKPKALDEVADAIVRMPLDEGDWDSHVSLIERTGYMDHVGEIRVEDLYERLSRDPGLIDAWQVWSDDDRSSPTWYLNASGPGPFEIGHIGRKGERLETRVFDDRARACAEYIDTELHGLVETIELWRHPWRLIPALVAWFREGR